MRAVGTTENLATADTSVGLYVDDIYVARQAVNNFNLADIERIAVRLLQAVEQPVKLDGGVEGHLSASVGVAIAPDHGRDLDRLLQLADLAMYEAKLKGKNRYALARMVGSPRAAGGAQRAAQIT